MIAYADNSTLYVLTKTPSDRLTIAESLNHDLVKIESWGMSLNPRKSTSVVISRFRTMNPAHPNLIINGHSLAMDDSFKLLSLSFRLCSIKFRVG